MNVHAVSIIVAVDENDGFGKNGKIPWYFPKDLAHFKNLTTGNICIMGRNTYEDMLDMRRNFNAKKGVISPIKSILPNRESFVITSNTELETPGAEKATSIINILKKIPEDDTRTIFAIGGERIFSEVLSFTSTVHLTQVEGIYDCDKYFPMEVLQKDFHITSTVIEDNLKFITYKNKKNLICYQKHEQI